jgi:aminomuconate-semialdehyde/2-hydroxymuconate-6-semialdehyde dehydrogenase
MIDLFNHIDGREVPARSGQWLDDVAPATGEVLARLARSGPDDVNDAVAAAKAAAPGWARTSTAERADLCDAIASALDRRLDELADLESRDAGKTITQARTIDIPRAVRNFRFFAGAVRHDETGCHEMGDALNYTLRRPIGVVGLITPWNLPLYLLTWKAAPALATGNTVVCKPSELTPMTASLLAEIVRDAGAPAGVFNLVHGLGGEAGQALVEHPDVRGISFTGGTSTGARVGAAAGARYKKLSLELGGKNSTIVFADADLDEAVAGAVRAGFTNTGQVCLCGSRVLVERSIADRFTAAFVAKVAALRLGDPADPTTEVGALISSAHREKVERYVALARSEGGTIACGGTRPDLGARFANGNFLAPVVVTGLPSTARTATEEIFGPVVTVHAFDTDDEAVTMANGVEYGLAASVWTTNLRRAHKVAAALEVGMVWVNDWLKRDLRVPFGGIKASGVGREGGTHSIEFFTETKNILIALR